MNAARPWIPETALRHGRTARPFVTAVASWSETWLGAAGWRAADAFELGVSSDWSVLRDEGLFQLHGKPKALLELAFAVLKEKPHQGLTDTDLRFLRRLGSRVVDDLITSIGAILPSRAPGTDAHGQAGWRLTIGRGQQAWLAIALSQETLATVARAQFPAVAVKRPLSSIHDALDEVPLSVSGRIGSARLAVEQVGSLEVGDLLLLDEFASTPLRLTVAGRLSDLHFKVGEDIDRLTLTMQE